MSCDSLSDGFWPWVLVMFWLWVLPMFASSFFFFFFSGSGRFDECGYGWIYDRCGGGGGCHGQSWVCGGVGQGGGG